MVRSCEHVKAFPSRFRLGTFLYDLHEMLEILRSPLSSLESPESLEFTLLICVAGYKTTCPPSESTNYGIDSLQTLNNEDQGHFISTNPHFPSDEHEYQSLEPNHQPQPYLESSPEFYTANNLLDTKYHPHGYMKNYPRGQCWCPMQPSSFWKCLISTGAGRYNDAYSDTYISTFDAPAFQTVPSTGNNGPDQWGHGHDMGHMSAHAHNHGHTPFLAGIPGREHLGPLGPDTKPMIQNGMLTGYPSGGNTGGPCFTGIIKKLCQIAGCNTFSFRWCGVLSSLDGCDHQNYRTNQSQDL